VHARLQVLVPLLVVVPWAVVVAAVVRLDYAGVGPEGIADERDNYIGFAGKPNPLDVTDYANLEALAAPATSIGPLDWYAQAVAARERVQRRERVFIDGSSVRPVADGYGVVGRMGNIGIYGVATGPDVFVADWLSLANPIGSRLEIILGPDARPGHSQAVPAAWDAARFAAPSAADPDEVVDARAALRCGDLAGLDEAITAPLTAGRFLSNVRQSVTLTRLSIPVEPAAARARFCSAG
jgi:arabinofuranosyltransferase